MIPTPAPPPLQFNTTLAEPVGVTENFIVVVSAEGITNPGSLTAGKATPSYITVDAGLATVEYMEVDNDYIVGSVRVPVIRGTQKASLQASFVQPHAAGAPVQITVQDNYQLNY